MPPGRGGLKIDNSYKVVRAEAWRDPRREEEEEEEEDVSAIWEGPRAGVPPMGRGPLFASFPPTLSPLAWPRVGREGARVGREGERCRSTLNTGGVPLRREPGRATATGGVAAARRGLAVPPLWPRPPWSSEAPRRGEGGPWAVSSSWIATSGRWSVFSSASAT